MPIGGTAMFRLPHRRVRLEARSSYHRQRTMAAPGRPFDAALSRRRCAGARPRARSGEASVAYDPADAGPAAAPSSPSGSRTRSSSPATPSCSSGSAPRATISTSSWRSRNSTRAATRCSSAAITATRRMRWRKAGSASRIARSTRAQHAAQALALARARGKLAPGAIVPVEIELTAFKHAVRGGNAARAVGAGAGRREISGLPPCRAGARRAAHDPRRRAVFDFASAGAGDARRNRGVALTTQRASTPAPAPMHRRPIQDGPRLGVVDGDRGHVDQAADGDRRGDDMRRLAHAQQHRPDRQARRPAPSAG